MGITVTGDAEVKVQSVNGESVVLKNVNNHKIVILENGEQMLWLSPEAVEQAKDCMRSDGLVDIQPPKV